jgi:hypothetical protein
VNDPVASRRTFGLFVRRAHPARVRLAKWTIPSHRAATHAHSRDALSAHFVRQADLHKNSLLDALSPISFVKTIPCKIVGNFVQWRLQGFSPDHTQKDCNNRGL